jgi:transcriptional regulator GlxA family with amidase domain
MAGFPPNPIPNLLTPISEYSVQIHDFTTHQLTPFLNRLILILEENYKEHHFDIRMMSQLLCSCPMQVHRKIKKHTGISPGKFLLLFRLKKAIALLTNSELSINEIASQTGFKYPSTFIRAFQRVLKETPHQFRNQLEADVINWQKNVIF